MDIIQVPKPPPTAYNPNREPSTLIKSQIRNLEEAVRATNYAGRKLKSRKPTTEGEAARYIAELHEQLHQHIAQAKTRGPLQPMAVLPVRSPLKPTASRKRRKPSAARAATSTRKRATHKSSGSPRKRTKKARTSSRRNAR